VFAKGSDVGVALFYVLESLCLLGVTSVCSIRLYVMLNRSAQNDQCLDISSNWLRESDCEVAQTSISHFAIDEQAKEQSFLPDRADEKQKKC